MTQVDQAKLAKEAELKLLKLAPRSERCVLELAQALGRDPKHDAEVFRRVLRNLAEARVISSDKIQKVGPNVSPLKAKRRVKRKVAKEEAKPTGGTPAVLEFVVCSSTQGNRFGYITQGVVRRSVAESAGTLLAGSLRMLVATESGRAEAQTLADLFRLAFPELELLSQFTASAQAMLMHAFPTDDGGIRLRPHFNTRLHPQPGHSDRVVAMASRCGITTQGLVGTALETLTTCVEDVAFQGLGCSLAADRPGQVELVARVPHAFANAAFSTIASQLGVPSPDVEHCAAFVDEVDSVFDPKWLADEIGISILLTQGAPVRLSTRVFFARDAVSLPASDALRKFLVSRGFPWAALSAVVRSLSTKKISESKKPLLRAQPIHAICTEAGEHKRIRLYAMPAV